MDDMPSIDIATPRTLESNARLIRKFLGGAWVSTCSVKDFYRKRPVVTKRDEQPIKPCLNDKLQQEEI